MTNDGHDFARFGGIQVDPCPLCHAPSGVPCIRGVIWEPFQQARHPHRLTFAQFAEGVTTGFFTDDDGVGELATDGHVSSVEIIPSELGGTLRRVIPTWATHVVWYGR